LQRRYNVPTTSLQLLLIVLHRSM